MKHISALSVMVREDTPKLRETVKVVSTNQLTGAILTAAPIGWAGGSRSTTQSNKTMHITIDNAPAIKAFAEQRIRDLQAKSVCASYLFAIDELMAIVRLCELLPKQAEVLSKQLEAK